jgi:hypothetical protein
VKDRRGNSASNYGNDRTLDITMLMTSHLFDMSNTIMEMVKANMGVETFEVTIKLDSAYHIDAPLKWMVIEELVTSVKYLWHEKMEGIGQITIVPEWHVHPIKTKLLLSILKYIKLPGVNTRAKVLDELDSFMAMTWRVTEHVTKLIGNGMREW